MGTKNFLENIEAALKGVHFFSVGARPGCNQCGLDDLTEECPVCMGFGTMENEAVCWKCLGDCYLERGPTNDEIDCAGESHFSWSPCDSCGSSLGGDRHPAHGVIADTIEEARQKDRAIEHFNICTDCLMFHANGDLPDEN